MKDTGSASAGGGGSWRRGQKCSACGELKGLGATFGLFSIMLPDSDAPTPALLAIAIWARPKRFTKKPFDIEWEKRAAEAIRAARGGHLDNLAPRRTPHSLPLSVG